MSTHAHLLSEEGTRRTVLFTMAAVPHCVHACMCVRAYMLIFITLVPHARIIIIIVIEHTTHHDQCIHTDIVHSTWVFAGMHSGTQLSAGGRSRSTRHWRVDHFSSTVTLQLIVACIIIEKHHSANNQLHSVLCE